jgi:hypothetical protein
LVIAEVMPAPIAIARKAAFMPCRFGRPKEMLEAPQVVLTLSSSRSRRIRRKTARPAWPMRADRHHQRIDDARRTADAVVGGALHDLLGHLEADIGILGDAGLVVGDGDDRGAVLLDQRQHASSRSSSPVTELTSALPL